MPFVVTCPSCSKRLKTPAPVPAGRAVTCPQCGHAFKTTEDAAELDPAPPPPPATKRAKQEELAEAEIVDDEEDDRPRAKKRRGEDDEEVARPRAKKRRDDDDDEEVDDEPAPRRKAKKTSATKKPRRVLLLAIGLPLLLLLLVGGGFLVSSLLGGGAPSDMLAWAPSNTSAVRGIKFAKFDGNPALRKSAQQEIPWVNGLKIPLQSIDEVLIASGGDSKVFVIRTHSKLDAAALAQAAKAAEMTVNGKKYYRGDAGSFHVPSDFLLVYCAVESPIIDLLKKDAKVTVSADLRKYNGKAAGDVWEARTSYGNPLGDIGFGFSAPKGAYGGRWIVGDKVAYSYTFVFEDSADAQRYEPQLKINVMLFKTNSRRGKAYESFDYSRSGSKITITATGPIENDNYGFFGES